MNISRKRTAQPDLKGLPLLPDLLEEELNCCGKPHSQGLTNRHRSGIGDGNHRVSVRRGFAGELAFEARRV